MDEMQNSELLGMEPVSLSHYELGLDMLNMKLILKHTLHYNGCRGRDDGMPEEDMTQLC